MPAAYVAQQVESTCTRRVELAKKAKGQHKCADPGIKSIVALCGLLGYHTLEERLLLFVHL